MKKETVYVAIGNQKGGVGKSALTAITASCLHYYAMKDVAVIDCDYPQHSVFRMRNSDIETINSSPELQLALQRQFGTNQRKAYRIINATPEKALDYAQEQAGDVDIVLFDLPGSVDSPGILNVIFNMDYIFVPIIADKRVLQSSLTFLMSVTEYKRASSLSVRLREIILFWNRVDKRENTELYDFFNRLAGAQGYRMLETVLPDSKKFNKELSPGRTAVFRSTLFPPDKRLLKDSGVKEFLDEICKIINL